MSQTTQIVSIPFVEGITRADISTTAYSAGGAKIENGRIVFSVGPDFIEARYVPRSILVQGSRKKVPDGFKNAGEIFDGSKKLKVLVEFPPRS